MSDTVIQIEHCTFENNNTSSYMNILWRFVAHVSSIVFGYPKPTLDGETIREIRGFTVGYHRDMV